MKNIRVLFAVIILMELTFSWSPSKVSAEDYYTQDQQSKKIIKEGLVGAGVGAVAAGTSGGNAGKGALIGAGTNVIGNALVDTLTGSSQPQPQPQVQYVQQVPERGYAAVDDSRGSGGCGRRR